MPTSIGMTPASETKFPPLTDEESDRFYPLDKPENAPQLELFKRATGITDPVKLKAHLIDVQRTAFKVRPYPCIRGTSSRTTTHYRDVLMHREGFGFLQGKLARHPAYDQVKALQSETGQPILVDLGCFRTLGY